MWEQGDDPLHRIADTDNNWLMHQVDEKRMSAQEAEKAQPLLEHEFREFFPDPDPAEIGTHQKQE